MSGETMRDMTVAGIRAAYAAGLEPAALMAELRERAAAHRERNLWIHLLDESELAPWLDALGEKAPASAPLWGVPFVLKDNIDLAGIPTTAGCEAFAYTPERTAPVAQRLIDAGALPLGKTNLDQFATGLNGTRSPWGACRNAFDPGRISGGSSAGSAVGVALGLATFGLGTDTAGSGRVPAGFNNLVGLKPTRGLLPTTGVVPACRSLDCVSVFALTTDDAETVLASASGPDDGDGYSRPNAAHNVPAGYGRRRGPLTLGVLPASSLAFFGDEAYARAYAETLETLEREDPALRFVEIDYAPFDETARLLYEGPWVAERYVATLPLIEERPEAVFPVVRDIIAPGGKPSAADLFRAEYRLQDLGRRCGEALAPLDALLTPTAGRLFTIDEMLEEPVRRNSELGYYTNFVNLLDMAAVALPAAFTEGGLPFGLTIAAPAFADRALLSIANRLQTTLRLPLGALGLPAPELVATPVDRADRVELAVCGAHMRGLPLNGELTERGATFLREAGTTADYRLHALEGVPRRPGLVRLGAGETGGASIAVEVWSIPTDALGAFVAGIPAPLGIGRVALGDGSAPAGFLCERAGADGAEDISGFGGWRAWLDRG